MNYLTSQPIVLEAVRLMHLEELAYSLPSAQNFVGNIASDVGNGVTIVLLPDNLSRAMVGRLIRDRLNTFTAKTFSFTELYDPGESDPVMASAEAMKASWPNDRTLRNVEHLLCCEGLPDLLYVHRIASSCGRCSQPWTEFIEGWAREWNNSRSSANHKVPTLCVLAKLRDFKFHLPEARPGLTLHWWWGFPSALEMQLTCRVASHQYGDAPEVGRWREHVLPSLVGSDVQLAGQMWDRVGDSPQCLVDELVDYWKGLEEPDAICPIDDLIEVVKTDKCVYRIGQELPLSLRQPWASGALVYTPEYGLEIHPGLLAYTNREKAVEKVLWRGEAEFLLPVVNEIRLRVCDELTEEYGDDWPGKWEKPPNEHGLEQVNLNPHAAELGRIDYLFRSFSGSEGPLSPKRHLSDLVRQAKNVRNQIAHYNPIQLQAYVDLCKEREKVGL